MLRCKIDGHRGIHFVVIIAILSVFIISVLGNIKNDQVEQLLILEKGMPSCFVLTHTGIPCPTCGLTRAFYAFFDGHLKLAFSFNILVFPVVTVLVLMLFNSLYFLRTNRYSNLILKCLYGSIFVLIVGYLFKFISFINIFFSGS